MSYECGLCFPATRTDLGVSRDPAIVCDGCGLRRGVHRAGGIPYEWFINDKPAPGWMLIKEGSHRRDLCPKCRVKEQPPPSPRWPDDPEEERLHGPTVRGRQ